VKAEKRGLDRLGRWYRALELLAFGGDLERARFMHLGRLADRSDILLLGEGDGRCAERLARLAPRARILCIDKSPGMIALASARIAGTPEAARVSFLCADALSYEPEPGRHDAVATLFFLDCFDAQGVAAILARVGSALQPDALWLIADFVVPPAGLARLRARAWLSLLYAFFRLETGISARELPPSEELLVRGGWSPVESADLQHGLVRSAVFARTLAPTGARPASA
jgi:SAM-dependent methyltransferase